MFNGTEEIDFKTSLPRDQVYTAIEDALADLGDVRVSKRGRIEIDPRGGRANDTFTDTKIYGDVEERKGRYTVVLDFTCAPNPTAWIIGAVLLFVFLPLAAFAILWPMFHKDKVAKACRRALEDLDDAVR